MWVLLPKFIITPNPSRRRNLLLSPFLTKQSQTLQDYNTGDVYFIACRCGHFATKFLGKGMLDFHPRTDKTGTAECINSPAENAEPHSLAFILAVLNLLKHVLYQCGGEKQAFRQQGSCSGSRLKAPFGNARS